MFDNLTDDNFLIFAMKCYTNPNCVMSEFQEDLNRIKYIKRLIRKYRSTGEIKERLLLNHIIVLGNVFGVEGAVRMLFYKMDVQDYHILKTVLLFLNYMPKSVLGIRGRNIVSGDVGIDLSVAAKLRSI
jgi:hypothetical protein